MRKKEGRIEHQQERENLNCQYCGLLFKNQANLSRHRKSHQVRKIKHKSCKCICGQYISSNNINKHSQSKKHLAGVDFEKTEDIYQYNTPSVDHYDAEDICEATPKKKKKIIKINTEKNKKLTEKILNKKPKNKDSFRYET